MLDCLYHYRGRVTDVHDGDTCKISLALGFGVVWEKATFRLYGINAPEMFGESKPRGIVSRDRLRELILDKDVTIKSVRDKREKFGRFLAVITLDDGTVVNDLMLKEGLAIPFMVESN